MRGPLFLTLRDTTNRFPSLLRLDGMIDTDVVRCLLFFVWSLMSGRGGRVNDNSLEVRQRAHERAKAIDNVSIRRYSTVPQEVLQHQDAVWIHRRSITIKQISPK